MQSITPRKITTSKQGHRPLEVVGHRLVVGMVVHAGGTLRLFEDPFTGGLYAEVNGFTTESSRRFLEQLDRLGDIASDILVCDRPARYPLEEIPVRELHVRRHR